ncbi:pyridoxamine 5'-phosphate oxidase family protein [Mycobacterium intracellulare]|uniref:Pyridoxamine 5'-phosphate oxidase family protein n=1 Tax=Mycobacterium intracellulare subsp. chimaera TaxID=222805 RepID=A0A1Y0TCD9_MYCIT|nr:pyridoxamine 5'-phosphate oxidase family protein [Mycobacterium intracellulare]AOS93142.1 pyridoxamine 5'-phosphate oxidase [Mycobacterium intracellulare subsp. chimaera]ARV83519.1 pyridoxamine 5'-phosphate oxidase [Mycobacterium intracellulare subsp. chimaera]ASL10741.1 pyridoxamine 5'-phosphate oxidase family protein [Mycobacterium intracellulare subsp. chimaera]ASL16631.1 pyridoxamine 5'-phosphate oxidase family protein [Mycobacterium intracellulare subsp. chimaera]ASL22683.1 pyridoxamin
MLPDPISATDLNIYGDAELPWARALDAMKALPSEETPQFLGTVRADGSPHSAGIGSIQHGGHIYFTSGPATLKSRNLAANPACTLSFRLPGVDLVLDGVAHRTTDGRELDEVTARYRDSGWPCERDGDAVTAPYSAQSAGPPPWYLYRFVARGAVGVATAEPHGATRWRFAP